jgi:hypothetical protein
MSGVAGRPLVVDLPVLFQKFIEKSIILRNRLASRKMSEDHVIGIKVRFEPDAGKFEVNRYRHVGLTVKGEVNSFFLQKFDEIKQALEAVHFFLLSHQSFPVFVTMQQFEACVAIDNSSPFRG